MLGSEVLGEAGFGGGQVFSGRRANRRILDHRFAQHPLVQASVGVAFGEYAAADLQRLVLQATRLGTLAPRLLQRAQVHQVLAPTPL